ncbi:sel1 repeat family protein [Parasaccharibacter apium]|uniref:sel1 repeat family protein n=1 Tax=Parasaccharibacter apium TaxID=1510841 RepID=UPI0018DCB769|nr:sel1 repeat family protein [Parasaccharibacter apium]
MLRKSAEQGYANAQYLLETAYLTGHIVPKDVRTTRDWFQKAAAQGYQPAPEMLQSYELR